MDSENVQSSGVDRPCDIEPRPSTSTQATDASEVDSPRVQSSVDPRASGSLQATGDTSSAQNPSPHTVEKLTSSNCGSSAQKSSMHTVEKPNLSNHDSTSSAQNPSKHTGEKTTSSNCGSSAQKSSKHTGEKPNSSNNDSSTQNPLMHTGEKPNSSNSGNTSSAQNSPVHKGERSISSNRGNTSSAQNSSMHTGEKPNSSNCGNSYSAQNASMGEKLNSSNHSGEKLDVNALPDELLLRIFSYFTPQQLCSQIAPVFSNWHRLSREPTAWRTLTVLNISHDSTLKLFKTARLQHLKTLEFEWPHEQSDFLLAKISEHCPGLTSLKLSGACNSTEVAVRALAASCPNITSLHVSSRDTLIGFCGSFKFFRNLKVLHVTCHYDRAFSSRFDISGCSKLEQLHVCLSVSNRRSVSNLGQTQPALLESFLDKSWHALVSLQLANSLLLPANCFHILAQCSKLSEIGFELVSDNALTVIARLSSLKKFSCIRGALSTAGIIAAFNRSNSFPALQNLTFYYVPEVTDKVLIAVADNCPQLTYIFLYECDKITDKGVCRIVAKCSDLETLRICGCSRVTGFFMWTLPNYVPCLRNLHFIDHEFDAEYARELKRARPDIALKVNFDPDDISPF